MDDQAEVIAFLADPATHGLSAGEEVARRDTHISAVFLAGERAFKLKRAVGLSFLDFTTLAARRRACLAEIAANRPAAPELYEGVAPVLRAADGRLSIGPVGESAEAPPGEAAVVDWLVVMRRFDQDGLFIRLAESGALDRHLIADLAVEVAAVHERAEVHREAGGAEAMRATIDGVAESFAPHLPAVFDPARVTALVEAQRAECARHADLLEARRAAGLVRRCHGDLHLRNICLWQGRPTLFDAIEFNQDFVLIDVLYDLAFLLMDMGERGLADLASVLFNVYQERRDDIAGLALLPVFLSLRAAIRAHVAASMAAVREDPADRARLIDEAHHMLARAEAYLAPPAPRLVAVGGLSGSGKSRLARALAPYVGAAPGALVLRSDVVRKRLMGQAPLTRLGPEGYRPEMTEKTYRRVDEEAAEALAAGHSVIADAVFATPGERADIEAVAARAGVPFEGLWLSADPEVMAERVRTRQGNASDATEAVLKRQFAYDLGAIAWHRVDSSGSREDTLAGALAALGMTGDA
ncbi:AAA family ATPase [Roseospirillum parvum]|uniref:Aminoglycoside phosphotransferase domain-containing protein n=1 Tax=Roseospirillum parvum TaxID=83401 RepID=A0A1G8DKI7_9PROT|nr:bifunctional aminoglycoside phosphotransferase/ATP-binding protein [Roseospirillum parvum]SDH57890.1 hypothetical protein SAMN05421742_10838 [Roseospirillum parvum]